MTLLLTRSDVRALLTLDECIAAVEEAFRLYGEGGVAAPGTLGTHVAGGGFHVKAAVLAGAYAAKVNANLPGNPRRGLPTIQGVIVLADAADGRPLAVLDSMEVTLLRTGAASAVAAKYLARSDSRIAALCGCGQQGRVQLRSLARVLPLQRALVWDVDEAAARSLADELAPELKIEIATAATPGAAAAQSDVCVTCTPSRAPFLSAEDVRAGAFIAAVGAASPEKQELHADLMLRARVVTDLTAQCQQIGELHHAPQARADAELGEIVAGKRPGRLGPDEIIVFDSTGIALQDVAAASLVYARAVRAGRGREVCFSE